MYNGEMTMTQTLSAWQATCTLVSPGLKNAVGQLGLVPIEPYSVEMRADLTEQTYSRLQRRHIHRSIYIK